MSSEVRHIGYLDGWRGGSIFLLLIGHLGVYPVIAGREFNPQGLAVECFFVLSGRLMAEILFVRESPISRFYVRRVSRIFPALWVFAFVMFFASIYVPRLHVGWLDVANVLTFTSNYRPTTGTFGHVWSLCVEEHAYLLLSLIALWHRRNPLNLPIALSLIAAAMIANGLIQIWVFQRSYFVWGQSDVRAASVLFSAAIFLLLRSTSVNPLLPILAISFGFAFYLMGSIPVPIKQTLATCLIAFGLVTLGNSFSFITSLLSSRVPSYLGIWSYSLYIWQQPFVGHDRYHLLPAIAGILAVSLSSFYFLEKPMRHWINALYDARFRKLRPVDHTPIVDNERLKAL